MMGYPGNKMNNKKSKNKYAKTFSKLDFAEEGRQDIYNWSERRQTKFHGFRKSLHMIQVYGFNVHLLRSFVENFNFMVILQMSLAAFITYLCKDFDISYDVHVSLFISPIVFPLAFSINTDFQRKEKVLEDLAQFKSSAMMWFFCMRDWREACSMDLEYMKGVRNKIKGIMFHLREYLLTEKLDHRKFIVRVIYEDFSDANQLNEKVRCSSMAANPPLVSRVIHFLNMMCLSFERLRVIREYRSPRSIRSFTKVLIFILPLLLSPYYVYLGSKLQYKSNSPQALKSNTWSPYYISIMVAFVFGALQGVQDKLDDPFDGMSEDDINLDTLDEWTLQSLEATCHRAYKIGRFQVVSSAIDECKKNTPQCQPSRGEALSAFERYTRSKEDLRDELELEFHPYAGVLHNIQGNTTILRHGQLKHVEKSADDLGNLSTNRISLSQSLFADNQAFAETLMSTAIPYVEEDSQSIRNNPSSGRLPSVEIIQPENQSALNAALDFGSRGEIRSDAPTYGVASYLASVRKNTSIRSHLDSRSSKNSSVSSSRRGSSPPPAGSTSQEALNAIRNAEFYIGDERVPRHPDDPSKRYRSRGSSASINPLVLNMHLNSDEDSDDTDDTPSLRNASPFGNMQQRHGSRMFETLHRAESPVSGRFHRTESPVRGRLHRAESPVPGRLHSKRSSSPYGMTRSKSVDASLSRMVRTTQQNHFSLVDSRRGSSPLLKVDDEYLPNGLISPHRKRPRFASDAVHQSNSSISCKTNGLDKSEYAWLRKLQRNDAIRPPKHQNSPRHNFLSPQTNGNAVFGHSGEEESADDDRDEDENSTVQRSSTPLLGGNVSHKRPPVPKTLQIFTSPTSERFNKTDTSPLRELLHSNSNTSPVFDNIEMSLPPKAKPRFNVNKVGGKNDLLINNRDLMIQVD